MYNAPESVARDYAKRDIRSIEVRSKILNYMVEKGWDQEIAEEGIESVAKCIRELLDTADESSSHWEIEFMQNLCDAWRKI